MTLTQINSTAIRDIQFETLRPKPQEMQVEPGSRLEWDCPHLLYHETLLGR